MISVLSRIFTMYCVVSIYKKIRYQRYIIRLAGKWREMNYKLDDIKSEWIPYEQ